MGKQQSQDFDTNFLFPETTLLLRHTAFPKLTEGFLKD